MAPYRSRIAQGLYDELERQFREQVHAFVGAAFEELCGTWTLVQASVGRLPSSPEFVGSDWGRSIRPTWWPSTGVTIRS